MYLIWQRFLPNQRSLGHARERELDDETQPPQEGIVQILLAVGGEDACVG